MGSRILGGRWFWALLAGWAAWAEATSQGYLDAADRSSFELVARLSSRSSIIVARAANAIFELRFYGPLVALLVLALVLRRQRRLALALLAAIVLAFFLERSLRVFVRHSAPVPATVARLRLETGVTPSSLPEDKGPSLPFIGVPGSGAGFPSGHVTQAAVLLLPLTGMGLRRRAWTLLCWALLSTLVGVAAWSQMALGLHAMSDCVGGLGLGVLCAVACLVIIKPCRPVPGI